MGFFLIVENKDFTCSRGIDHQEFPDPYHAARIACVNADRVILRRQSLVLDVGREPCNELLAVYETRTNPDGTKIVHRLTGMEIHRLVKSGEILS